MKKASSSCRGRSRSRSRSRSRHRRNGEKNNVKDGQQLLPLPPLMTIQESNQDVARLREHLAWTRESYNESLKELQEFQTLSCADRLELEHLRKLLKENYVFHSNNSNEQNMEDSILSGRTGNNEEDSSAQTNSASVSSSSSTLVSPLEIWYKQLQQLAQEKADCELRLAQQSNTLREVTELMHQARLENKSLQQQVKDLIHDNGKNDSGGSSTMQTSNHSSAALLELQEQVDNWEALYFESAELGARTIQLLENRVQQLEQDNQRLERERNDAFIHVTALSSLATSNHTDTQRRQQQQHPNHQKRQKEMEEEKKHEDSLDKDEDKEDHGDNNNNDSNQHHYYASSLLHNDDILWMERIEELEQKITDQNQIILQLQQQNNQSFVMKHHDDRLKYDHYDNAITTTKQAHETTNTSQSRQRRLPTSSSSTKSSVSASLIEDLSMFGGLLVEIEPKQSTALMDIFCCGSDFCGLDGDSISPIGTNHGMKGRTTTTTLRPV